MHLRPEGISLCELGTALCRKGDQPVAAVVGVEQRKALYKAIADGLAAKPGIRPEDVLINLIEVKKENWSYGNGVAQYVIPPPEEVGCLHAQSGPLRQPRGLAIDGKQAFNVR